MKKFTNLIFILITFIALWGCTVDDDPSTDNEKGVTPTHDFSVTSYLQDNAVFPQNSEFVINGISENGVLLKVDIYDEKDALIKTASDIADNNGEFSVKIIAPKGSYNQYKIVITDSVHEHVYQNILFGEVWLYAGEQLESNVVYEEPIFNEFVRIFNYSNNKFNWESYNQESNIYNIAYEFGNALQDKLSVPVAVIDSTLVQGNADAWISHFTASNQLKINSYLKLIDRYIPSPDNIVYKTNNMSSMYKTFLEQLNGIAVKGLIWQQGVTDFDINDDVDIHKLLNNYTYLTSNIFLDYINFFKGNLDIYSIQNGFVNIKYANVLRSAQEQATYLVNNVHIVPTYDCHIPESEDDLNVNYVFSTEKYVERITNDVINYTYQKEKESKYSMLTNVVINNNLITLTFSNDINLIEVEEIYGLNVSTIDQIDINYSFEIEKNKIIIELNDLVFTEDMELTISYAENNDLYKCNLYNVNQLPVLSFSVEISD